MEIGIKKIIFLFIFLLSPIFASIIYWIEEPLMYPEPFDLFHRVGSVFGIFSYIWMCFNILVMIKSKVIESNFSLKFLNAFHLYTATIALILGSLHYPFLRIGGELEPIQTRTGNFGWASFVLLMVLAIIFMSNSLLKKVGNLRVSMYKKKFKYSTNKVLHNLLIVSVSIIFLHTIFSFTSTGSVIIRWVYLLFFGITLIGWFYHKIIRRFRSDNDPYLYRRASWDDLSLEIVPEKNIEWTLSLIKSNPSIYPCLMCGVCTTECSISVVTKGEYNPRRNILAILLGYKNILLKGDHLSIWGCTMCHTCDEVCPQDISLTNLFTSLKNQSIAQTKGPAFIFQQARAIFDNAKAIPSQPAIERRRREMGLPSVLIPDIYEMQTLLKNLGIDEKLKVIKQAT
ncbi:MAG: 4Fe-4S dicluster domain-containing protein [Candidatus Hermodarchaeota archaeon]